MSVCDIWYSEQVLVIGSTVVWSFRNVTCKTCILLFRIKGQTSQVGRQDGFSQLPAEAGSKDGQVCSSAETDHEGVSPIRPRIPGSQG